MFMGYWERSVITVRFNTNTLELRQTFWSCQINHFSSECVVAELVFAVVGEPMPLLSANSHARVAPLKT